MSRTFRNFAGRIGVAVALVSLIAVGMAECKCIGKNSIPEPASVCASACGQGDLYCGGGDFTESLDRTETERACSNCITFDLDLPGRSVRVQGPDSSNMPVDPSINRPGISRLERSASIVGSRSPASLFPDRPPLSVEELATTVLRC